MNVNLYVERHHRKKEKSTIFYLKQGFTNDDVIQENDYGKI